LHVDDLAESIKFIIENNVDESLLNVGSNEEISIYDLVQKIKNVTGYEGEISFDASKPDGNPRKLLDSSKINNLGWKAKINLDKGLKHSYEWFLDNIS
jgi:GDP-L-fucose synthase